MTRVEVFLPVAQDLKVSLGEYIVYRRSIDSISLMMNVEGMCNHLIEEYILPISTFSCEIFKVSILTNSMLLTQLLPELASD